MISKSGYSYNGFDNIVDDTIDLRINSAGHFQLKKFPRIETTRPAGRPDYQLLYVASGIAHFQNGQTYFPLPAGSAVVYYPNHTQFYYYTAEDASDVFWVHFTGNQVSRYLKGNGFPDNGFYMVGINSRYVSIFNHMIHEQQLKKENYDELCKHYLLQLLLLMNRGMKEASESCNNHIAAINRTVTYFHGHYNEPISICKIAKENHLTPNWFNRCFQDYYGMSPQAYLMNIRIEKAKEFLTNYSLSIAEVSQLTGYSDAFYFSRIFKRKTGLSPQQYRKNCMVFDVEHSYSPTHSIIDD